MTAESSDRPPPWFAELDHTADIGIQIEAPTLEKLYERSAWGMFFMLTDLTAVTGEAERTIEVEGTDPEDLLLRWLSELNFLHITEKEIYCAFEVTDRSERRVAGTIRGEPIDPTKHTIYTEIKAVTYHGLEIEQTSTGWRAQIIFDM